jgi:hypothetical protein
MHFIHMCPFLYAHTLGTAQRGDPISVLFVLCPFGHNFSTDLGWLCVHRLEMDIRNFHRSASSATTVKSKKVCHGKKEASHKKMSRVCYALDWDDVGNWEGVWGWAASFKSFFLGKRYIDAPHIILSHVGAKFLCFSPIGEMACMHAGILHLMLTSWH